MPKRHAEAEEYESDGGFVDDAPKTSSKKVKTEKKSGGAVKAGPPEWEVRASLPWPLMRGLGCSRTDAASAAYQE